MNPDALRAAIVAAFPDLAGASFRVLGHGYHSTAVEADGRLIFKFPRDEVATQALVRETRLLPVVRKAVGLPVPDLALHPGPPLFSRHEKLHGEHLVTAVYERLDAGTRQRLAEQIALFYAELHRLDPAALRAAGAEPVEAWRAAEDMLSRGVPALPAPLRARARAILAEWRQLPPDPYGTVFGFFDGHGWNMAFDAARGQLNGIYDFADAGFGPLHQEFIYTSFVSADLTDRVATAYEAATGRILDRRRVWLLTGIHRLSEVTELADDPVQAPEMVRHFADWAASAAPAPTRRR